MTIYVENLHVEVDGKEILKGVNLLAEAGKVTVLMGQNGSGKSTLVNTIMGHPRYMITQGKIFFNNEGINDMKVNERAKKGLFLSFQYPSEVTGVSMMNFLKTAYNSKYNTKISFLEFKKLLEEKLHLLEMDKQFIERNVNEGFSGGEKKRSEILQLAVLQPSFALIDEVDSGLDIQSLKNVGESLMNIKNTTNMGMLLVTHYNRILKYIHADKVYIMAQGKVIKEGTHSLVDEIEQKGYTQLNEVVEQK